MTRRTEALAEALGPPLRLRREPCGNCPFLKSAPLAYWHPDEYRRLLDLRGQEAGRSFGCHKDRHGPVEDQQMCVGWLLWQRRNRVPSISLRVCLIRNKSEMRRFKEMVGDEQCYHSISELVADNLAADRKLHPERHEA